MLPDKRIKVCLQLAALLPHRPGNLAAGAPVPECLCGVGVTEAAVVALLVTGDDQAERAIRTVAEGKRLVVLLERRLGTSDKFLRVAEVGYTREGSGFGKGISDPECVVTGGYGNIVVTHKGKKYLVCCTGCRDYFNDNPEKVLAEYYAKKEAEKKNAKP